MARGMSRQRTVRYTIVRFAYFTPRVHDTETRSVGVSSCVLYTPLPLSKLMKPLCRIIQTAAFMEKQLELCSLIAHLSALLRSLVRAGAPGGAPVPPPHLVFY